MDIEEMCQAARSRIAYAIAANVEWQKKKMAEQFANLRKENYPVITGKTSISEFLAWQNVKAQYNAQIYKEMEQVYKTQNLYPIFSLCEAGSANYWRQIE